MVLSRVPATADERTAPLPNPRGPLSAFLLHHVVTPPHRFDAPPVSVTDPIHNDDFQLALYVCYEQHYAAMAGVDEHWEWSPSLLEFRARLERTFEHALRNAARAEFPLHAEPAARAEPADEGVARTLHAMARDESGPSLSAYVEREASAEQFRELVVHRSLYQLKEADPQTWGIPRLKGRPKAALVEIQYEEYGDGRAQSMHATLYRDAMESLGLDASYGAYLNAVPGIMLANVNVQSLFGLHRRWRGALIGHLALYELTSPAASRRYANGARRLELGERATRFYDEHVGADEVHGDLAADVMAQGLADDEPELATDIVFGARALAELENRFAKHVLAAWRAERSSLRRPRPYDGWVRA